MLVFLTAALLIAVAAAAPRVLTQGLRQKEEEMIWRGEQYARGVRLYYRKYGRFPQAMEDLTKENNGVRFMRQAYKDPMNREDGSWRLIYVTPAGQLVGSVKRRSLLQFPTPGAPTSAAGAALTPGSPAGQPTAQRPLVVTGVSPATGTPPEVAPSAPEQPTGGTAGSQLGTGIASSSEAGVEGKVFGGNIIGVGSKVKRRSLRVYDGGSTYLEWEFIWDATKEAVGQPVAPAGQPGKGTQPPLTPPRP
jgi:hypothetical protein